MEREKKCPKSCFISLQENAGLLHIIVICFCLHFMISKLHQLGSEIFSRNIQLLGDEKHGERR